MIEPAIIAPGVMICFTANAAPRPNMADCRNILKAFDKAVAPPEISLADKSLAAPSFFKRPQRSVISPTIPMDITASEFA